METNKIAVGLDIGTTKIVAMIGRKNEYGKLEILGIGQSKSLGVRRGVVDNITKTTQSIQQAIDEAKANSGIDFDEVAVGIAGQHIRSIQQTDNITREDSESIITEEDIERLTSQLYKMVMLPGEEIIHVLPQEYKIDSQSDIKDPIGMCGGRVEANFHVVVGQISSLRNIGRCVLSAGLKLEEITLEPLASAAAVLDEEEMKEGVALIDIGGGTTDLAIFKDGIIRHTAVIPFGGNVITNDVKEACVITEKQAELLKIRFGSAWPGENKDNEIVSIPGLRGRDPKEITIKNLSKIINSRILEIIKLVHQEIMNYGVEEKKKQLIAGIVVTGGGAELKHLKQVIQFVTGMDVRIGYPNEHLSSNSVVEVTSPIYSTAVGLVMAGLNHKEKEEVQVADVFAKEATKNEVLEEEMTTEAIAAQEEVEQIEKKTAAKRSLFGKWGDSFRKILDNAE
jgi:cell division protein FtsA